LTFDPLTVQFQQNRNAKIHIASSEPQSKQQNTAQEVANMIVLYSIDQSVLGSKHAQVAHMIVLYSTDQSVLGSKHAKVAHAKSERAQYTRDGRILYSEETR
jgi:hypothetical protein